VDVDSLYSMGLAESRRAAAAATLSHFIIDERSVFLEMGIIFFALAKG